MNKKLYIFVIALLTGGYISAQTNLLNAKTVSEIGVKTKEQLAANQDEPLSYGYIGDRDIVWSKVVWEYIDLNQKINLPFYFPIDTTNVSLDRRSLFDILLKGIRRGTIKNVYADSFFTEKMTVKDLEIRLIDNREEDGYTNKYNINSELIEGYMIKGVWYFDKRQGEMKYRLLAIAPMGPDVQTIGVKGIDDDEMYELFWVFYPSIRKLLHRSRVFNPKNVSHPISYDHLLNARRFSSTIFREENIYGNRSIKDYIRGNSLFQLLEADKIKESIRNKEMDMWNY